MPSRGQMSENASQSWWLRSPPERDGTSSVVTSSVIANAKTPSLNASARLNSTSRSSRSNCEGRVLTSRDAIAGAGAPSIRAHGLLRHRPDAHLRCREADDAPALFRLASRPRGHALVLVGAVHARSQARAYIAGLPAQRERGDQLDLLVVHREDGADRHHRPVGDQPLRDRRAVVGTWLGRATGGTGANARGQGARRAPRVRAPRPRRLGAYADVENGRSQAALERLGFVREGVLRRWHRHGDVFHDVLVYGAAARGMGAVARSPERPRPLRAAAGGVRSSQTVRAAQLRRAPSEKPRIASTMPTTVQTAARRAPTARPPSPCARDHRAGQPVDQVLERQRLGDVAQERRARCRRRRRRRR